ncbi:MAG: hypothetical protein AUI47_03755 [Acidobacteria bacterium 13_1_40CM_2_68_5]|nr:MAG: hypothetical protein AUI47_03755 [Acidobacteria bacterium 13_1_40CM_2_68_5]
MNQDVSGDPKERGIAGVDFAYRLLGQAARARQLWIYGETVHGTRSADVDCTRAPDVPSCQPFQGQISPTGQFVYMLRNATSLEGFLGLRWEFLAIKPGSRNPAHAYLKAQAGFLSVSGSGGDVTDVHHVGLGLTLTSGEFLDSYLEIGFGRTDLFQDRSTRRFKVDGFLSHPLGGTAYARAWEVRAFVEMTVDTDLGPGSDSIQSYVGFDFTPRKGHGRPGKQGPS